MIRRASSLTTKVLAGTAVYVIIWEAVVRLVPANILPTTLEIVVAIFRLLASREFRWDLMISGQRVVIGYLSGSLLGLSVAMVGHSWPICEGWLTPLIRFLRPLPPIALAPFAVLLFGLGESSKYTIIAFGVFFPVWISLHSAILTIDTKIIWAAKSLGAVSGAAVMKVKCFLLLPYILTGLRTGIGTAYTCLVGAELSGAIKGLMYRVEFFRLTFRPDELVGGLVILGIIGFLSDLLFYRLSLVVCPQLRRGSGGADVR